MLSKMNCGTGIEIVVPAYNCAAWLDTFFQSIVTQDHTDWRIIARDDASRDDTYALLSEWKERLGERLLVLDNSGDTNLGMIGNYDAVLTQTTARWVMLADPDDVWLPHKITMSCELMHVAERSAPDGTPVLMCSDASVVDEHLRMIAPSYWQWSGQDPGLCGVFHRMIVEGVALTSTIMVNRALLNVALPLTGASCPDWWLSLSACAFGKIVSTPQSTVLYRRHSANDSLAPLTVSAALRNIGQVRGRVNHLIGQYGPQAGAFLNRFGDGIKPEDAAALRAAHMLPTFGPWTRRKAVIRHKLWFASTLKNASLMLLL
jgi:Glycosyl transferase family 2